MDFCFASSFLNDREVLMGAVLLHVNIKYSVPVTKTTTLQAVCCMLKDQGFFSKPVTHAQAVLQDVYWKVHY